MGNISVVESMNINGCKIMMGKKVLYAIVAFVFVSWAGNRQAVIECKYILREYREYLDNKV